MKDFHPISLCNIIYMLIMKVLVNRLRTGLISPVQSGFVPRKGAMIILL